MARVGAVDCGTNTIKLLIGELPEVMVRESRMVRLGQGVDTTGELAEDALVRTFAAIDDFASLLAAHPVERLRFCATSATRDAANAGVFAQGVYDRLGVWPEVVSGAEEASLGFDGVVRHLRGTPVDPVLVIDIGGGSTELVLGALVVKAGSSGRRRPASSDSRDMGSVRLHERHLHSDPPTAEEIAACVANIDAELDATSVDLGAARSVVGVAGTITTIAAGVLGLASYDPERIDQAILEVGETRDFIAALVAMTVAERRALPYMAQGRADVIGAGALILDGVLARTRVDSLIVSESDILDGIAWSIADGTP
jgi:exopolyphosphatase/guanosine-5'-triphosphate,3'-diphosphate pyrophosphatase